MRLNFIGGASTTGGTGNLTLAAAMGLALPADSWVQLLQAMTTKAAAATPQSCSNAILAAAKVWGGTPEQPVADALLALACTMTQQQATAAAQDVANSRWALSELRLAPQPLVQWLVQAIRDRLPAMIPQAISNTALALARAGRPNAQLFGPLWFRLLATAQQQGAAFVAVPQQPANLVWAVAVADQRQLASAAVALVQRLAGDTVLWAGTVRAAHQQLYQVHQWLLDT